MHRPSLILATLVALAPGTRAALVTGLVAHYDFEESGSAGLANKAPGATLYNATASGTFTGGANPSGPGFSGNAAFNGGDGLSNRSDLLAGNALNLVDARNEFITVPLGTAQLGQNFTLSAWHALTPGGFGQPSGPYNNSNRFQLFEASNNFDVSWGTNSLAVAPTTGSPSTWTYLAYVNEAPGGGFGPTGVATGIWQHVTQVFSSDGTNTTLSLYLNGSFVGSRTSTAVNFNSLLFGRERNSPDPTGDRDWDGMIDEIGIWSRSLSGSEVTELYNLGVNGTAIPEPRAALLGGLGLLALLRRRRR